MRKRFVSVVFILPMLLAGCSADKNLPQNRESDFSSVGEFTQAEQDENLSDEATSTITETAAPSAETQAAVNPADSRETEAAAPSSSANKPTQSKAESKPIDAKPTETKPTEAETKPVTEPAKQPETAYQAPDRAEVERKTAGYINSYRSTNATVLSGLTSVARYRSNQLVKNFTHADGIDACNALQYGEFVDMTLYGMSESDSYYQGYNREAIAKGNWTGTADEIARKIADGFKNSPRHWSYLSSNEYSYIAVGCTYDEASSMWYCCICVSSKNYGG